MATSIQQAKITGLAAILPAATEARQPAFRRVYDRNRHRIYSLAFWMTDNEIEAEDLMRHTFLRAFAADNEPSEESIDRALVGELRERMPLGILTLDVGTCTAVHSVRSNILRVELECALVQAPATERLIFLLHDVESYDHARIARTLGILEDESRYGLHQARLKIRELLAAMRP